MINQYEASAEKCGDLASRPRTINGPSQTTCFVPIVRKNGKVIATVTLAMTYRRALRCAYIMATKLAEADAIEGMVI